MIEKRTVKIKKRDLHRITAERIMSWSAMEDEDHPHISYWYDSFSLETEGPEIAERKYMVSDDHCPSEAWDPVNDSNHRDEMLLVATERTGYDFEVTFPNFRYETVDINLDAVDISHDRPGVAACLAALEAVSGMRFELEENDERDH